MHARRDRPRRRLRCRVAGGDPGEDAFRVVGRAWRGPSSPDQPVGAEEDDVRERAADVDAERGTTVTAAIMSHITSSSDLRLQEPIANRERIAHSSRVGCRRADRRRRVALVAALVARADQSRGVAAPSGAPGRGGLPGPRDVDRRLRHGASTARPMSWPAGSPRGASERRGSRRRTTAPPGTSSIPPGSGAWSTRSMHAASRSSPGTSPATTARRATSAATRAMLSFRTPQGGAFDGVALDVESLREKNVKLRTSRMLDLLGRLRVGGRRDAGRGDHVSAARVRTAPELVARLPVGRDRAPRRTRSCRCSTPAVASRATTRRTATSRARFGSCVRRSATRSRCTPRAASRTG